MRFRLGVQVLVKGFRGRCGFKVVYNFKVVAEGGELKEDLGQKRAIERESERV